MVKVEEKPIANNEPSIEKAASVAGRL